MMEENCVHLEYYTPSLGVSCPLLGSRIIHAVYSSVYIVCFAVSLGNH